MNLIINGKKKESTLTAPTVSQILLEEKVEQPSTVSVQLNGEFLKQDLFATTTLSDGDELEFLYFMGGGQR